MGGAVAGRGYSVIFHTTFQTLNHSYLCLSEWERPHMCSECIHRQDQTVRTSANCWGRICSGARLERVKSVCVFCFNLNSAPDDRLDATYITNTHANKVTSRLVLSFKSGKTKSHLHVTRERRPTGCRKKGNTFLLTQILFFTDSHRQSTISSVSVWSPFFFIVQPFYSHTCSLLAQVWPQSCRGEAGLHYH